MTETPDWTVVVDALREGRARDLMGFHDVAEAGVAFPYLATPFSQHYRDGMGRWAGRSAAGVAAHFAARGVSVFAPIVLSSAIIEYDGCRLDPLDDAFWTGWCAPALKACDAVVVADMYGWELSQGCAHEAREALRTGKPLFLMGDGALIGLERA
ncbi:DUF1937 family protein [Pikeienuella sp. HZG-20]|uniref:DUF1937 family protein n=1 Tax=Paludibacillus litoralis TaxID=3133267 RepID=UPI0030EC55DE